ncbi:MAG: CoA pyrophosphatase [Nannocystaceae bacterium]|nr:CoA pyrophosphatase [Nannocystaceae bacterium]
MGTMLRLPGDLAARLDPLEAAVVNPTNIELREAAVVVLLMRTDDGPELVLIERSADLRTHAGQLALPGGKPEPGDGSLANTALREAHEEVGLPLGQTQVLGRLGTVPTPTGFVIVPFVAWAPEAWRPRAASGEVHAVLTPKLATLADPDMHRISGRGVWAGMSYELHEFAIHDPPLWGATARIVWDLLERVR